MHVSLSTLVSSLSMSSSWISLSYGSSISSFLMHLHTDLHSGCNSLHSHCIPSVGGFFFSTSSPAFIVSRYFDGSHSDQCEMVTYCDFDLHFSENE